MNKNIYSNISGFSKISFSLIIIVLSIISSVAISNYLQSKEQEEELKNIKLFYAEAKKKIDEGNLSWLKDNFPVEFYYKTTRLYFDTIRSISNESFEYKKNMLTHEEERSLIFYISDCVVTNLCTTKASLDTGIYILKRSGYSDRELRKKLLVDKFTFSTIDKIELNKKLIELGFKQESSINILYDDIIEPDLRSACNDTYDGSSLYEKDKIYSTISNETGIDRKTTEKFGLTKWSKPEVCKCTIANYLKISHDISNCSF